MPSAPADDLREVLLQGCLGGARVALLMQRPWLIQVQGSFALHGFAASWQAQLALLQVLGLAVVEEVVQPLLYMYMDSCQSRAGMSHNRSAPVCHKGFCMSAC